MNDPLLRMMVAREQRRRKAESEWEAERERVRQLWRAVICAEIHKMRRRGESVRRELIDWAGIRR
jgi:hypothetical protein